MRDERIVSHGNFAYNFNVADVNLVARNSCLVSQLASRDESLGARSRPALRNLKGSQQSVSANCNVCLSSKGYKFNPTLYVYGVQCNTGFVRRTRNVWRAFCRSDFLAVGLYTLDRVLSITLSYVCLALCANQPPQRPRSPLTILDSS